MQVIGLKSLYQKIRIIKTYADDYNKNAKVNWQFTTADARVKLSRFYPTLDS
jgi:hypothetical protein